VERIVYIDCFSGASGDMMLGALLDLGLPIEELRRALGSLAIEYGEITAEPVLRAGISATRLRMREPAAVGAARIEKRARAHERHHHGEDSDRQTHAHGAGGHHSLADIAAAIGRSALTPAGKARAVRLFQRLGEAEAAIHATTLDRVHLHEVGALDSIIDIVGTVCGMEWLGADRIVASPLTVGSGTVQCAHGTLPVPAPATLRLLADAPITAGPIAAEMLTPTGALLVTEYARSFGPLPEMRLRSVGYGAGERDFPGRPNVLRLLLGEAAPVRRTDRVAVLECEIDDMNPQLFGPLMDRLLAAGALDVFYAPVQMKKNRPGTLITVIARPHQREAMSGLLFAETTTIGVRHQELERDCLEREVRRIETPLGGIRFKIASRDGRIMNVSPEFDDCAAVAAAHGLAIKDVQAVAMKAWLDAGETPTRQGGDA
jgi:pyridinium-3,5-bisthiocarboxylic acid mononucleotide nickel chelatase